MEITSFCDSGAVVWNPVDLVDPGQGRRTISAQAFGASFSGVAIELQPGPDFARGADALPAWRIYWPQIARIPGIRFALLQIVLASLVLQAVGLAPPLLTKILIDHVLPRGLADGSKC